MQLKTWTKGILTLFALLFLFAWAFQMDAWARAGRGSSMGSRGSRSMSAPRPTAPSSTYNPTRPSTPPPGATATPGTSSSGSFMRSIGGGLLGGLAGGMLFRSLFGGPAAQSGTGAGATGGGGIGMMDILLLAGIAYLIYWYIKKKRTEAEATAGYYQSSGNVELPPQPQYAPVYDLPPAAALGSDQDLERGLANIRQYDPYFDEAKFQEWGTDTFFKIQGAWANRDMATVRTLLTDEMYRIFQGDADSLKAQKKINRLENIAVRSVDITEAWQESGSDFITVRVFANLLDYNVDETSGQVVEGSKTDPVKFEEYWTFTRSVGNNPWQLSAINQPT
ncbi:MAG: Tim44 domain-containing protein [Desulfobacterales bacterium]|nr:Tim44 domain-containing protein [Pseudomonadota bacterium]MBU4357149.1 Tim44 domain-containing protein [Pseudomonadota bacterium]MCG2771796.1 Tim44 domain-containing protein [Desulfobacterales bacterium]